MTLFSMVDISWRHAVALPAELIMIISELFEGAEDLLSFSLLCRRYYHATLAQLKDKGNKRGMRLLDLHAKRVIGIKAKYEFENSDYAYADVYYRLPNGYAHGKFTQWAFRRELLMNSPPSYIGPSYLHYITKPEEQEEVLEILEKGDKLMWEGHKYFDKRVGKFTEYWLNPTLPTRGNIKDEGHYHDGELDGPVRAYNPEGNLEAIHHFVDGLRHGEAQQFVEDLAEPFLLSRCQYVNDKLEGIEEQWAPLTGIRVQRIHWKEDQQHGREESWDPVTGVKTFQCFWVHGRKEGLREGFHPITGSRISLTRWKDGVIVAV